MAVAVAVRQPLQRMWPQAKEEPKSVWQTQQDIKDLNRSMPSWKSDARVAEDDNMITAKIGPIFGRQRVTVFAKFLPTLALARLGFSLLAVSSLR